MFPFVKKNDIEYEDVAKVTYKERLQEQFNKYQKDFYTSISAFSSYTNFEHKTHGFTLLHNMTKGYPALTQIIYGLNGFGWSGIDSPELFKAIQRNFVNRYSKNVLPQFVFYKKDRPKKLAKSETKETKKGKIFSDEVKREICQILWLDSKDYEYLKFSKRIQNLGMEITGEYLNQELNRAKRSKKSKNKLNI